jgi:hypothetical protein
MSIPNYLYALANHKGPATVIAGGMSIPVKITDLEHRNNPYSGDVCTFNCLVVNPEEIQPMSEKATACAARTDYVRESLAKAAAKQALNETKQKPINPVDPFQIKNVYFNNPVTVVIWADGTKTIVRCQEGDVYSPETGLALGNKGGFNDVFHKWIPEEEPSVELQPFFSPDNSAAAAIRALMEAFVNGK